MIRLCKRNEKMGTVKICRFFPGVNFYMKDTYNKWGCLTDQAQVFFEAGKLENTVSSLIRRGYVQIRNEDV